MALFIIIYVFFLFFLFDNSMILPEVRCMEKDRVVLNITLTESHRMVQDDRAFGTNWVFGACSLGTGTSPL